jgi:hypothetical protein
MAADDLKTVVRATDATGGSGEIGTAGTGSTGATTVYAMPAWKLALVRAAPAGLQSFASVLGVGATGLPEWMLNTPSADFLTKIKLAAAIGFGTAAVSIVQDTIEFLKGIDQTHPQYRA